MINQSGIYQIRNLVNGKVYVGSAKKFKTRWGKHKSSLNLNKHHSKHLQSAWNKHGANNFVFEPLITCAPSMLLWYEQQFLDQMRPEYNKSPTAGNTLGVPWDDERRAKILRKIRGRKLTPEQKANISAGLKGRVLSAAARKNMSVAQKNRVFTPEERNAASERAKQRNVSPEMRAKLSLTRRGKPVKLSPEHEAHRLKRIGEYNRTRPITQELRENMSAGQRNRPGVERFEYEGKSQTVLQWAEEYGLCRHVLRKRINAGWSMEKALTQPARNLKRSK